VVTSMNNDHARVVDLRVVEIVISMLVRRMNYSAAAATY
jgi:hypothetical protein